jgi:hypothetical protein
MHCTNSKATTSAHQELRAWVLSKPAHACSICGTSQGALTVGATSSARFTARCQEHLRTHPAMRRQYGRVGGFSEDHVWFLNNPGRTTRYRLSRADEVVEGMPTLVRLEDNNCLRLVIVGIEIDKDAPEHVLAQAYDHYRAAIQ